jgi:hypothetical protein
MLCPIHYASCLERSFPVTPDQFVSQIRDMVSSGRDQETLAFAQQHDADISPLLTFGQQVWVADTLHMAAMLVGMEEYAAQQAKQPADLLTPGS